MRATGFLGTRGMVEYSVTKNGEPFDLDAALIVKLQVVDNGVAIDSDSDDVVFNGSTVAFKWGAISLAAGVYSPTIYAYRAGDTEGEVIAGPTLDEAINLTLIEDERP